MLAWGQAGQAATRVIKTKCTSKKKTQRFSERRKVFIYISTKPIKTQKNLRRFLVNLTWRYRVFYHTNSFVICHSGLKRKRARSEERDEGRKVEREREVKRER